MRELLLDSTLQELALEDFQVESAYLVPEITTHLKQYPLLPGVVVMEEGNLLGMISRRRLLEQMSSRYSVELFSRRSIKHLIELIYLEPLVFDGDTSIMEAARKALERSSDLIYEPILVKLAPQTYRLLDVHQLLIAQSRIHELARRLLHESKQELERIVDLDALTQVANRRCFNRYFDQEWRRLSRERSPLSVILGDVDCFKAYNDAYGHLKGDECLKQVAGAIKKQVKRSADLVARYGGEEFAIVLPNTPLMGAFQLAEEIRLSVKRLNIPHEGTCVADRIITLSLGVASIIPSPATSSLRLLDDADMLLYEAKRAGRDRVFSRYGLSCINATIDAPLLSTPRTCS